MASHVSRTGSLLIVGESEFGRHALQRTLSGHGYTVHAASDGYEALAFLAERPCDLVLLDVEMRGLNGLEMLRRIRQTRSRTELPVIMVTEREGSPSIVEAFQFGANDYVSRPVDIPIALARIDTHLAHKWTVADLHESEERYTLAVRGANDGLWDWNLVTNEVYRSARWKAILGYDETEIGVDPDEWFSRIHADERAHVTTSLEEVLSDSRDHFESEHRLQHRDGTYRWVRCRGAVVRRPDGVATRIAGSLSDITDVKVSDSLTGLPNRLLFVDLLDRAIKRTQRRRDYSFALLVIGLDRFRMVHDGLGALSSDRLLVSISRRLQSCVRGSDALTSKEQGFTLARLGGDEFTILLDDISDATDAIRVGERVRTALQQPFELDGQDVFVSARMGIAVSWTGYDAPEAMLHDATTALHRAVAGSTKPYELFDPTMRERAVNRLQNENDLRKAVEHSAFDVHYQPIVSMADSRLAGFEALIRWRHPQRGLVGPNEFIRVAEDTGMILPIGRLVLVEACREMARWRRRFGASAPDVMCVNVSARQFADGDLAATVEEVLDDTGLHPTALKLEITESACIGDMGAVQGTVDCLRAIGVKWSIDDFGTGYSSLSQLHQLQVDTVKIDRRFISQMGRGHGSEMMRAIVGLAHNLGMDVVAEGIETADQLANVAALGCEHAQGFYFSKPIDAAASAYLIASQSRLASAC